MVSRLYLDGCSMVYGSGLERHQCLGNYFQQAEYEVTDASRGGKSNMAIAIDTYQNATTHDIFVLGFTYSTRFHIRYQNFDLDFFPGYHGRGLNLIDTANTQEVEQAFREIYKYFYTVFGTPYCDDLSDFLVDAVISFLLSQGKTVIPFSWESRQTRHKIFYPYLGPKHRLPDGHLNASGMQHLYQLLTRET